MLCDRAVTILGRFPPQLKAKRRETPQNKQSCVTFQAKSATALHQFNKPVISVTHPFN
jgi:hypothetical protein